MVKKILLALAVLLAVFLLVVALQPSTFLVTRSATISAAPAVVFAQVNDLPKWPAWSPWEKLDPAMKRTYQGPPAGVGAVYAWAGNKDVGTGRMTITDSRPNESIRFKLEFFEPMAGVCSAEFKFTPEGNQTAVTWSMTGANNYLAKAVCLFMNMDKMLGGQFEQGLADLKKLTEAATKK